MNEQIKKLAEQAGLIADGEHWFSSIQETDVRSIDLERFADLVRQDEREACAKLCDELANNQTNQSLLELSDCAAAIRARSDK
jgi:hypothetical protein